jgi:2-keto-4-pentenoate hydratase/2-oxohepta-3-ene-1,7-dioic acid hydratase in catechol pathway
MEVARVLYTNKERFALVKSEEKIVLISDAHTIFSVSEKNSREPVPFSEIKFLPPVIPSKLICIGLNYKDHAEELIKKKTLEELPSEPILFLKAPSALIGNGDAIIYPQISQRVDYEGELAVVMGKRCKGVSAGNALEYVFGYTCMNDITARDLQKKMGSGTAQNHLIHSPHAAPGFKRMRTSQNCACGASLMGR